MTTLTDRALVFRSAIVAFIERSRQAKLNENAGEDEVKKYEYEFWLAEAAKVAGQVQLTTHPLKATFPDARIDEATSPLVLLNSLPSRVEIGSHCVAEELFDGTGNAAHLRVTRIAVEVVVEGRKLIHWVLEDDPDLLLALGAEAPTIVAAFKRIWRLGEPPSSHYGAKQVYWLAGDEPADDSQYHLLQPLFSSSLAHVVHADIQEARFGENSKAARQARREKAACDVGYREYRDLAVRKLGGTKPQNISQLNSERRGDNYLLSSLPPLWNSGGHIKLLHVDSVLAGFRWFPEVPELLRSLIDLLRADPGAIKETRDKREALEQALGQQLALFGDTIRLGQEPGWTRDPDCCLALCEKLWLDPERSELPLRATHESEDADFNAALVWGDWPDQVASRFANWLNDELHRAGLKAVGDVEYKHWARQVFLEVDQPVPLQRRAVTGGAA